MLNLNDLLAANIACRIALLGPDSLRQLLSELDAQAPPGSFISALHHRGFAPDRVQQLQHATLQRRAQLETQYFLALVRAHNAVDPGVLHALSQRQAQDGYSWSIPDVLVSQRLLAPQACTALTHEAAQQMAQREQVLLHENRRQGYALVLETGTTSGRHLTTTSGSGSGVYPQPRAGSGSGVYPQPRAGSGSYPSPSASGSAVHRAPSYPEAEIPNTDFDVTLPVDGPGAAFTGAPEPPPPPGFDAERTQPVAPPSGGFDPERTMAYQETLAVPQQPAPPPEPDFDAGAPTLLFPPGAQGAPGDSSGLGNDPCRTIGFEDVIMTPAAQPPVLDELDAQRTMQIPAPSNLEISGDELTINLPPPGQNENPFGTIRMQPDAPGGGLDATITIRPDLSDDPAEPVDMPAGLEHVRELGRGNMGIVYLARQPDQRLVAVKVIQSATKEAVARFRREILVSATVKHPHVIEVLDSGTLPGGQSYMAMEYLEGCELKDLIKREAPLPIPRCLELLDQLLAALEATHNAEIVHRDLKPENVQVLTRQGGDHIKLVDFGISRLLNQVEDDEGEDVFVTMRGTLSGTPMYVAPEAIIDPDEVTKAHDIYAAGVILYEMLTGKLPFAANRTLRDLLRDTVHSRPMPLEEAHPEGEFPSPIKRLVSRLLEKDNKSRPADGGAARAALLETQRLLRGDSPETAPTERIQKPAGITQRWLRKITGIFRRNPSSPSP